MVWIRDEGGRFDAPLPLVWEFVGSGDGHSRAHLHRESRRTRLSDHSGEYSWVQEFGGREERFTMRWTAFPPVGIVYEVREGPFSGSSFFLYYTPRGEATEVSIVGEFVSPTLPPEEVEPAVLRFFSVEFDQDGAGIGELARSRRDVE